MTEEQLTMILNRLDEMVEVMRDLRLALEVKPKEKQGWITVERPGPWEKKRSEL